MGVDLKTITKNQNKWLLFSSENEALDLSHRTLLKINSAKKISNRLYNATGQYVDLIKSRTGNKVCSVRQYNDSEFILCDIAIAHGEPQELTEEDGVKLFNLLSSGFLSESEEVIYTLF